MSCGCKIKKTDLDKKTIKNVKPLNIVKYSFKIVGFLIALLTIPFIVLYSIWFMFDLIVLNNQVDMQKATKALVAKIKFANEDNNNYDDDFEEIDDNEYIAVDVEDISPIKNV
jgi:hypothetical protein